MSENIQVRFKKQKISPQLDFSIYRKNSSPLCPDRIPKQQIVKFQTALNFLQQTPIHNYAEKQFIQRIQQQAFINKFQLQQILHSLKVDKNLLLTIKNYFSLCFNHRKQTMRQSFHITRQALNNYVPEQEIQHQFNIKKDSSNETNENKLYQKLVLLSAYETLRVKILIQTLLFLKDVYEGKFIHKKLINQFQKLELMKKLQIYQSPESSNKKSNKNDKIVKKSSVYFRQRQNPNQESENTFYRRGKTNSNQTTTFTIIKSKVYTILVLQYEKLQTQQQLFKSHKKLIQKAIQQRQARLQISSNSYYLSCVQTNHSKLETQLSKVETNQQTIEFDNKNNLGNENDESMDSNYKLRMEYENLTAYLVLKFLKLKIQYEQKNKETNILKELKVRKNECRNEIEKLEQSLGSIVKLKNSPYVNIVKGYIDSKKMYLKSLNQVMTQMKQRLQRQLMGQQVLVINQQPQVRKSLDKNIIQERKYSSTNYQSVKNSIYELTLNILQQNKRSSFYRNRSNQRILQQYIKTHNSQKHKKQHQLLENNFLSTGGNTQYFPLDNVNLNKKNKQDDNKLTEKTRSLTRIRQNLHKNIFPQQQSKSSSKRSRSLFNAKNQTSIKTLLQSPLNRQIQIYLEYQKFLNSVPQQPQQSQLLQTQITQSPSDIDKIVSQSKQNTQKVIKRSLSKNSVKKENKKGSTKLQQNGIQILNDIMKSKKSNGVNKLLTSDKKRKIKTIYKAFAYNNKIIDISHWKLEQQIRESSKQTFFNKNLISTGLTHSVCNFGAGLKDFNQALDQLLADRCYMNIRFVKFWQTKPCFFSVRLSQQKNIFTLYLKMNNLKITMLLPRGNNILCERYHTIWPTIRYLFQKKIFQFPIIKFFQQIFYQKKSNHFTQNQSSNYKNQSQNSNKNNKTNVSQFKNKETSNFKKKQTIFLNNQNISSIKDIKIQQPQRKSHKRLIGKDSFASSMTSQLYQHNQFEENQCSVYQPTFGEVTSDQVEELNSCFDYVHKFLGLVCSQIRGVNGQKDTVWPLQDNVSIKQLNQISEIGQQNNDKLFKENQKVRKLFFWRKIAKFWVTMEKRTSVHLLNFIKKVNNQNYYFFSVSISKQAVARSVEIFLQNANCCQELSEEQKFKIGKKYMGIELGFEVTWRECNKGSSLFQSKENFTLFNVSYQRLSLYHIGLKFFADTLMGIVVDNRYNIKFLLALNKLFQDSLFIETSVEGQKVYDLYSKETQKYKRFFHSYHQIPVFKDLYRNPHSNTLKLVFDFLKIRNQQQNDAAQRQQKNLNFNFSLNLNSFSNQKSQIQVIQNFFDLMSWNHYQNQVRFKPNSKWKIVKRKIHTIITFVNHLNKKNQRKSSLLGTQKIKQTHQFMETNQTKKIQKICPLMMKTLQRVNKSTLNFLQKIQNEVYRIKVNLSQSLDSSNQGNCRIQKWMAECILMKQNSKQYQKFYISSADIEAIFLSSTKKLMGNQSQSFSESYDLFKSYGSKDLKYAFLSNKQSKMRFNNQSARKQSFQDKNSGQSSLQEIQQSQQSINQSLSEDQRQSSSNYQKNKNRLLQWTQFIQQCPNDFVSKVQSKQKNLRMFAKIIRSISFTKIKCFSKILLSRDFQSEDGIEHFIAEPRSSLQILHQNIQNPQKTFELKYFVPLQNCYQTIICKPIKVSYQGRIDFVIITLFKIDLKKGENIYQFRINLNKNQTYYACEITQTELRNLVDFSQKQKITENHSSLQQQHLSLFTSLISPNSQSFKSEQGKKYQPPCQDSNFKIMNDEKQYLTSSHKKRSILKGSQRRKSNLLNVQQFTSILTQKIDQNNNQGLFANCNNLVLSMVGKLQEFTKQVLQNIFKRIQIQIVSGGKQYSEESLLLTIPEANFKKLLKIRVLERISRDKNCIYMVEINQQNIRKLNQIVLKSSMNNNFDIFQQNIFKNKNKKRKVSDDFQQDFNSISSESSQQNSINQGVKSKENLRMSCSQFVSKVRNGHHQGEINLLFSSFSIFKQSNKTSKKIQVMNTDNVIENIAYEVEKKYGKQILLKFNNKKIKSYAEIFFNYYLKYVHPTEKQ